MPPTNLDRRQFLQTTAFVGSALTAASEAQPIRLAPLAPWKGELTFTLDPPVAAWTPEGSDSGDRVNYRSGDYRLQIDFEQPSKDVWNFRFHLNRTGDAKFKVHAYAVRARTPFTGIYRVWDYRGGPIGLLVEFDSYTRGIASGDKVAETAAANTGIPMVVATDREGRNRFMLGMLDQVEVTGLRIGSFSMGISDRGEGLNYVFEFQRPQGYALERTALTDGARLDLRGLEWVDTVAQYTEWVESAAKIPVLKPPAAAWEPIWNTWYPFGQAINEKIIHDNAAFCRQTGITTLCLDAGYNNALTKGMGTAADIDEFNAFTGDWTADPGKFPRFRAQVDELHGQGHKVTVWVALFIVGKSTKAYPHVRSMLIHKASGAEHTHLCPRHPDTPRYLAETFLRLARDYDLDGFWLDFMDDLHSACHASHPHFTSSPGEAYNRCLGAVRDAVLKWKPDFIIETRMKMANINMKQFANALETTDMPFDFDLNRSLGIYLRSFSKGVSAKLDPAQWHIRETNENVAKSCATVTLAGVPVFGVDFRLLPASHLEVVAAWMRFYRQHQADFTRGEARPVGMNGLFPQFQVRAGAKAFHYIGSSATAPVSARGNQKIYIANASDSSRLTLVLDDIQPGPWKKQTLDCFLKPQAEREVAINAPKLVLDEKLPQGGMLVLEKL